MTAHEREKLTYQYMIALDGGDMDTVARILTRAEQDPELERMILEMNHALVADDPQSQLDLSQQEKQPMPVFTPTKRKRNTRPRWTAIAAILASVLFSGFALFFTTQSPTQDYSAENIAPISLNNRADLTRQFLNAWNNNNPQLLEGLLTADYRHSELGLENVSNDVVTQRIHNLNSRFKEIHFFMDTMRISENRLTASLTLKGLHRNVAGQELNYVSTGFINVTFEGDQISATQFTINVDDFINRYGQFEEGDLREAPDFFQMSPDDFDTTPQTQTIDINDDTINGMSLNVDAGHAQLRIGSVPNTVLMGDISNIGAYDYREVGRSIKIINIENHPYYLLDEAGELPIWFFKIGEGVRADIDVTIGNSDAMLDLRAVDLQGLTLTMGGGTASLSLPETGANYHVTVTMLSSLARLELDYPLNVGLKIDAGDGVWQSRNYNHAQTVINLQLNGSLSSLDMLGS